MQAKFFTDRNRHSVHVISEKEIIPHGFIEVFPFLLNRRTRKRIEVIAKDDGKGSYFYWADKKTNINYGFLKHGEPFGYKLIWLNTSDIEEENKLEAMIEQNKLETPRTYL